MASINDIILKHQVYLQRVSKTLEDISADIISASDKKVIALLQKKLTNIQSFSPDKLTAGQLASLQKQITDIRTSAIGVAQSSLTKKSRDLAENEAAFAGKLITQEIAPGTAIIPVAGQQLNNIVRYDVFSGNTLDQWFKGLKTNDVNRIMSTVRMGMAQGETTEQIVKTLAGTAKAGYADGVFNTSQKSARMIARTVTNGIANSAKRAIYKENQDVIYGVVFSATLDSRTSPICMGYDGTVWKIPEEEGSIQNPPLHPNCRSTLVPAPTKEDTKTNRPAEVRNFEGDAEKKYNAKQQEKENPRRWQDLAQSTKRRKVMNEQKLFKAETGKNPFKLTKNTYEEFFNRQPASFQKDILGPTRYDLYKKGGMDLKKFTDFNNRDQFTIAELRLKDKDAFVKAGLM